MCFVQLKVTSGSGVSGHDRLLSQILVQFTFHKSRLPAVRALSGMNFPSSSFVRHRIISTKKVFFWNPRRAFVCRRLLESPDVLHLYTWTSAFLPVHINTSTNSQQLQMNVFRLLSFVDKIKSLASSVWIASVADWNRNTCAN